MAFEGPGLPSPMPSTVLQDGLYQTLSSSRSTLQPQTNHPGLVVGQTGQMPLSSDLAVIAEGSLLNKVFHSKKDYLTQLKMGLEQWARHNGLPTILRQEITDFGLQLWQQHTHKRSPATSPKRQSPTSNPNSKEPFSTAKTSRHPLFVCLSLLSSCGKNLYESIRI